MSSLKIRVKRVEAATLLRVLINHPMETGRKQDKVTGALIPAWFIQEVKIAHNGQIVAHCRFTTAVSRDPYLSLRLRESRPGDTIKISWVDNLGHSDSDEITLQ
jgi:sulfur-oxidizing protein SoxZ